MNNNNGLCPKTATKEESSLYSETNESQALHKCSRGDWAYIKSRTIHFLLSQCSSFCFLSLVPIPFSMLFSFLINLYLHHIFTIHFYLISHLFLRLLPFSSEEDGGRNLLSCGLHYSSHFLINAADKAIVHHLM